MVRSSASYRILRRGGLAGRSGSEIAKDLLGDALGIVTLQARGRDNGEEQDTTVNSRAGALGQAERIQT